MASLEQNRRKVREYLRQAGVDAVVLSKRSNFSWYTRGAVNHVVLSSEEGAATLVLTAEKDYCVCTNIEEPRLVDEELAGLDFEVVSYPWYESLKDVVDRLVEGGRYQSDLECGEDGLGPTFCRLRFCLDEEEIADIRDLGQISTEVLEQVCRQTEPGQSEDYVAAEIGRGLLLKGMRPAVLLVAADQRILRYRHPIPTDNRIEKYLMAVIMAERRGLMVAATRLVHFGPLPESIALKMDAVARIDALMIQKSRPGNRVADILQAAIGEYEKQGYADEWKLHHQGGPCGYWTREYLATKESDEMVLINQPFAWNPSITGVKSEDTCLVLENSTDTLTRGSDWPTIEVEVDGETLHRPAILVL